MGISDEIFYPTENIFDVKCMICLQICEDARRMTNCTHHYCNDCIEEWLQDADRCPQCLTSGETAPPSPDFQQRIENLPAKCYNYSSGCRERVPYGRLADHARVCLHRLTSCPRRCGTILPIIVMPTHLLTCGQVDPLLQYLMCYECRDLYTSGHRPAHCNFYVLARNLRMQQLLQLHSEIMANGPRDNQQEREDH